MSITEKNYALIKDTALVEAIKGVAPQLAVYRYDPATATVLEPS